MKSFSDKPNKKMLEGVFCQQIHFAKNVKRSPSERSKMIQVRNSDLHEGKKNIREGINEHTTFYYS